jgi:hypothetical protein
MASIPLPGARMTAAPVLAAAVPLVELPEEAAVVVAAVALVDEPDTAAEVEVVAALVPN